MASADEEVSKITDNKENSVHTGQHGPAIEAHDLASLLNRFEEATSSTDDMNVPPKMSKAKRDLLMRAKSAGNSPAATPPATPPPYVPPRSLVVSKTISIPQSVVVQKGMKSLPIQLKLIVPPTGSLHQQVHVVPASAVRPSTHIRVATTSTVSVPLSVLTSSKATTSARTVVVSQSVPRVSYPKVVASTKVASATPATMPITILPIKGPQVQGVRFPQPQGRSLLGTSAISLLPSTSKQNITILKMPASSSTPQTTVQSIPAQNPPVHIKATINVTTGKILAKAQSSPKAISKSAASSPAKSKASATVGSSLLQSMLQAQTPMNPQMSSTQLTEKLSLKPENGSPLTSHQSSSQGAISQTNSTSSHKGMVTVAPKPVPTTSSSADHDYCFLKLSTKDLISETIGKSRVGASKVKAERNKATAIPVKNELKEDDMAKVELDGFGSLDVKKEDGFPDFIFEPSEGNENETIDIGTFEPELEAESKKKPNQFVFEEGEVLVDDFGNDMPLFDEDSKDDESSQGRIVSFGLGDDSPPRRKARRPRRQAEFSTSPIREDKGNFFDKIPSYYTALSIPTKPTKTSVFASATRSIGSTDHLDLMDVSEVTDDGHFDKVPAHRRLFTNTAKDLTLSTINTEITQETEEVAEATTWRRSRRRRRSSHHSHHSSSSRHSRRSVSAHSASSQTSRSPSPQPLVSGDESRSRSRGRSTSRGSGRSSSSCSTCSSRSYCSTCSGGSSMSRSRSRSISPDERDSRRGSAGTSASRSRSRSPNTYRDWRMRQKRSRHSFSSRNGERHHSRSRSRSPREERSRSRSARRPGRHRTTSGSSDYISRRRKEREEEKIRAMEERRVVYVGKIPDGYTKRQLHRRFESFGEIKEVKLNFREHGDNYGFVTFAYSCDAIAAKERGNNVPGDIKFDLCFGGRRRFCPDQYADLDGNREIEEEYAPMPSGMNEEIDYAALLRQHSSQQRRK